MPNELEFAPTISKTIQEAMASIVGGGANRHLDDDGTYVLATVRVLIECKGGERGVVMDVRPIYEYPLLKLMWRRMGGDCTISKEWMKWNEDDDKQRYMRRIWRLTRGDYREEIARLSKTFSYKTAAGTTNLFAQVYGVGNNMSFIPSVRKVHEAWISMVKEARKNKKLDLTNEQYAQLGSMLLPEEEKLSTIEFAPLAELSDADRTDFGIDKGGVEDPLIMHLTESGVSFEVASDAASCAANTMDEADLRRHAMCSKLKPDQLSTLIQSLKKYGK